jgi:hypothetical protein
MNSWLFAAGVAAVFTFSVHTFIGGRLIARPFLEGDYPARIKVVLYGCWHLATITLAMQAGALFWAAYEPSAAMLAWAAATLYAAYFAMTVWIILLMKAGFKRTPHWLMFSVTACLAFAGLV